MRKLLPIILCTSIIVGCNTEPRANQHKDYTEDCADKYIRVVVPVFAAYKIRQFLDDCIFMDYRIKYIESGAFRTEFLVKGPADDILNIQRQLEKALNKRMTQL